ncbi:MAG: hypothetical protein ACYCPQ_04065 [Elusimicrobiota bacterium]
MNFNIGQLSGLSGTALAAAASSAPSLGFHFGPGVIIKLVFSTILSLLGAYYLASGKKNQEPSRMIWGAVLILASFMIF